MEPSGHRFVQPESSTCLGDSCPTADEIGETYDFVNTYGCDSVSPTGLCMDASGNYVPNPVNDAEARAELKAWGALGLFVGGAYFGVELAPAAWRWFLLRMAAALCADGDCGNEVRSIGQVFWSGGQTAKRAAEAWARANEAMTLEMTEAGERLEKSTRGLDWFTQARPQWVAASRDFAENAAGEVHVFHNSAGISLQSIWATVEYQALMANQNVTRIIYHAIMPDGSEKIVIP